jgi:hypothetical protein
MFKRATGILAIAAVTILSTAVSAMAQTTTYPPPSSPVTSVAGTGGTRGTGGTAFTGSSQISVGTLMLVALVIVGLAALFVARRRAARFSA